jgi:dTDP-4-dehydrorhamnose reductase
MRSSNTRILITGGEGQLASALSLYFPYADYPGKKQLDVANHDSCDRYFWGKRYDLVIHTAAEIAYNAPRDLLESVNVDGTWNITRWAEVNHARMVYISTDYCYPGTSGGYVEEDTCQPVGPYAESKYAGECAALTYGNTLAIRTSFYSRLDLQSAATDAFTSKMPIHECAALIAALSTSTATGAVNVGGPRRSLYEIAVEFNPRVQAINRSAVKLPYQLPRDVSLDCSRMKGILGR